MPDNESKDENKVMDVAKPGESKPETGSKPMVIGHKTMASDPAIKETPEQNTNNESPEPIKRKKITLQPLTDTDIKQGEESDEKTPVVASEETVKDAQSVESEDSTDKPKEEAAETQPEKATPEKTAEADEQSEEDKQLEQEAQLKEIVKSKQYAVPIKEQSARSIKTFFVSFTVVLLVGLIIGALLIDAEIIDVNLELPFDFL